MVNQLPGESANKKAAPLSVAAVIKTFTDEHRRGLAALIGAVFLLCRYMVGDIFGVMPYAPNKRRATAR